MKKSISLILGMAVIMQMATGCGSNNKEVKSMEQLQKENGVPVEVTQVSKQPFSATHTFHAVLSGIKETSASAMVADKVDKILYSVGDGVDKDAVVITFPTDNPSAQYFQAKVAYEHAEATVNRMKNLYGKGGISLQEYENARTQFEVSKANWDAVRQTVKVKAPISGIISSINVRETDNVKPGDKLFTVSQTQKLKAKLWVSEEQINDIRKGNEAIALWRGAKLTGKITQVDLSLNTKKQAFGVVAEFENPAMEITSGVNAEIQIFGSTDDATILTERKNVVTEDNQTYVYVAQNNSAQKRKVVIGRAQDVNIEILDGLEPGEFLITKGQTLLENNMKIKVMN